MCPTLLAKHGSDGAVVGCDGPGRRVVGRNGSAVSGGVSGARAAGPRRISQPLALRVDPIADAAERDRFFSRVVCGPGPRDCHLWVGAIGSDGYGRFAVRRGGHPHVVRTSRYAAAVALQGGVLAAGDLVLHLCDLPLCVRAVTAADVEAGVGAHIVLGSQSENMRRMAFMARGGGRRAIATHGAGLAARVERSRALREAVRDGWDDDAVEAALLGQPNQYRLW